MKNEMKPIVVIGAGIVGVSTALWLQNQGKEVKIMTKKNHESVTVDVQLNLDKNFYKHF